MVEPPEGFMQHPHVATTGAFADRPYRERLTVQGGVAFQGGLRDDQCSRMKIDRRPLQRRSASPLPIRAQQGRLLIPQSESRGNAPSPARRSTSRCRPGIGSCWSVRRSAWPRVRRCFEPSLVVSIRHRAGRRQHELRRRKPCVSAGVVGVRTVHAEQAATATASWASSSFLSSSC